MALVSGRPIQFPLILWKACPVRTTSEGLPEEPSEPEVDTIRNNPLKLAAIRSRLSDIGWWMRLLCQQVATRANRDDKEVGKFWQSRFRAVRLLDEQALLACAAYVDLNPIRAALAQTLEASDFTSIQRRIQALQLCHADESAVASHDVLGDQPVVQVVAVSQSATVHPDRRSASDIAAKPKPTAAPGAANADGFLSPLTLDERSGAIGSVPSKTGLRCSDKGFLPISQGDYLVLLDWTARQTVAGKRGATPKAIQPIFERMVLAACTRNTRCEPSQKDDRSMSNSTLSKHVEEMLQSLRQLEQLTGEKRRKTRTQIRRDLKTLLTTIESELDNVNDEKAQFRVIEYLKNLYHGAMAAGAIAKTVEVLQAIAKLLL